MELSVFSLNAWLLPLGSDDNSKRLNDIISYIQDHDFDIVCLQEVWMNSDLQKVKFGLSNYFVYNSGNSLYNRRGLLTLSKEPGIPSSKNFDNRPKSLLERIVGKGFLRVNLVSGLTVINAHSDAYSEENAELQLEELKAIEEEELIVCGDLNLAYEHLEAANKGMFSISEDRTPTISSANHYAQKNFNKFTFEEKRTDYVLTRGLSLDNHVVTEQIFSDHLGVKAKIKK